MKRTIIRLLVLSGILGIAAAGMAADKFPSKPVRLINPYAPGGANGITAQALQRALEKELGTKILNESIAGGSTKIGTMELMKARPDGYTALIMSDANWIIFYYSKVYDTRVWEKLTPIGNLTTEPYGYLAVRTESPFKSWADLVKAGKDNPGKLTCGGAGAGGFSELAMRQVTKAAGVESQYVPFAGAGAAATALLGGHIDFWIGVPSEMLANIRGGKARALAIGAEKRMEGFPDVPTFKEMGVPFVMTMTRSIWGPPQMPPAVVNVMTKAVERAVKDPDFVKLVETQLLYKIEYRPPERMQKELVDFEKLYGPTLNEIYK